MLVIPSIETKVQNSPNVWQWSSPVAPFDNMSCLFFVLKTGRNYLPVYICLHFMFVHRNNDYWSACSLVSSVSDTDSVLSWFVQLSVLHLDSAISSQCCLFFLTPSTNGSNLSDNKANAYLQKFTLCLRTFISVSQNICNMLKKKVHVLF